MPFIGLSPFLRNLWNQSCVCRQSVSMPFIGLLPFLHISREQYQHYNIAGVNALYRASSISTMTKDGCSEAYDSVSMPFIGLLPFLHEEWFTWEIGRGDVSMPFIRLLPFLLETELPGAFIVGSCQCPLSGFFHFYAPLWERPKMKHLQTRFCR